MATIGIEVVLYISAWGLCVARFDRMGNSQEPLIVKRATVLGFTLEPKQDLYFADILRYNNGNSMN